MTTRNKKTLRDNSPPQYTHLRSRAKVLRACERRAGPYTKVKASYHCEVALHP